MTNPFFVRRVSVPGQRFNQSGVCFQLWLTAALCFGLLFGCSSGGVEDPAPVSVDRAKSESPKKKSPAILVEEASPVAIKRAPPVSEAKGNGRSFGDSTSTYPATAGQVMDKAIYRALFETMDGLVKEYSPQEGMQKQEKGRLLTIWHSSNVHGEREDCGCPKRPLGGLGRKATTIAAARETKEALRAPDGELIVDAGNLLFKSPRVGALKDGAREVSVIEAEAVVEAFNKIGCHGFAVGEYELAMGLETLARLHSQAKFPWLSANLKRKGALMFKPFVVTNVAGFRVAIVGLTGEKLPDSEALEAAGVTVEDPAAALIAQTKALLSAKPDAVVLLSNLGVKGTQDVLSELERKGVNGPKVNLAVVSGTKRMTPKPVWQGDSTFLVESGSRGKYLGRVDLHVVNGKFSFQGQSSSHLRSMKDYLNGYRSLHNARRSFHNGSRNIKGPPPIVEKRLKSMERNKDLALKRLVQVEMALPLALPAPGRKSAPNANWLKSENIPLDKAITEVSGVREILDKHIARAETKAPKRGAPRVKRIEAPPFLEK